MKSTTCIGILVLVTCLGCAGPVSFGPSGTSGGLLFSNVTYPANNSSRTEYQVTHDDFEIVGPVRGEGKSFNILGLIAIGNSGYEPALKQARESGGDEIMNLRVDTAYTQILLGLFTEVKTVVTGTAVRWKR